MAPMPAQSVFPPPSNLFKPGSAAWLIRHHIRTRLRGNGNKSRVQTWAKNIFLLAVFGFAFNSIGKSVAAGLTGFDGDPTGHPALIKAGIMITAFMISLLGSSMISAYALFTDRDDLDLLLSSPLPPGRVLAARMLQSAYSAALASVAMGAVTFGIAIVTIHPRFALIFPVLFGLMLLNLAISFVLARAFMLSFGAKRGRTLAMALGFVLLIVGVLSYQINAFRGTPSGQALLANVLGPDGLRGIEQWAGLVGRLAFGQLYETLVILVLAVASFGAVGLYFWDRFADDAAIMAGQAQHHPKVRQGTERIRFLTGLYAVSIVKEWRSMLRDPLVLTQVATPLVSLIPLGISLYMSQHLGSPLPPESNLGIAGLVLVLFGSQITGTLAWTAASIEEAGDLLMSSPADGGHLFWSKALATAIPCFAFLFFGMVAVAFFDVQVGFLGLLVGSCGLACAGAIEFLRPRPARRVKMTQRPDRSIVSVLLGFLFSLNWSVATALAMWGAGLWTLIPIGLGVLALIFVAKTAPKA